MSNVRNIKFYPEFPFIGLKIPGVVSKNFTLQNELPLKQNIAKGTTKDPNRIFAWLLPSLPLVHPLYIKQCHLRIFVSTNLQFPLSVVGCLMGAVTLWTNDRGGWVEGVVGNQEENTYP